MPVVVPLVGLGTLVLVLWVIATAAAITDVILYISGVMSGLPWPLDKLAGPVQSLATGIQHVCGLIEGKIDGWIGAAWHLFASYLDFMWRQFEAQAASIFYVANALIPLSSFVHRIEGYAKHAIHNIESVLPRIRTLEREWHGIEHQVKTLERDLTKGIGHDLRIQVAGLEHDVTRLENKVIPHIRSLARTAEADVSALERWVSKNALLVGTTALTGAVAWALGQLGLGGLRCPALLRSLGNRGCGLWNGLEDLLGLFVDTLLLTNICDLLPVLETAVSDVADPLVIALTDVGAGLCHGGIGAAPPLSVPGLHLPANPGLTINLP